MWPKDMSYALQDEVRVLVFCVLLDGDVTITFWWFVLEEERQWWLMVTMPLIFSFHSWFVCV
jgi:hypothetical protein